MAKVTVTTDEGEVIEIWSDAADDMGDLERPFPRAVFTNDLIRRVQIARQRDGRDTTTGLKPMQGRGRGRR